MEQVRIESLPSRERGLKLTNTTTCPQVTIVAPLAGAWIEIYLNLRGAYRQRVAPLAGAWIEMPRRLIQNGRTHVAPLAGAWIEMHIAD